MAKTLVIVESPAKAKTIERFLGSDYEVKASVGHVRDLPERELGVDPANNFAPNYITKRDKKAVVESLRRSAKGKRVLLAPDPDREGEAISWHVAQLLDLDPNSPLRVTFGEITPQVVRQAVTQPRPVNQRLVDAQQARRVLDRLVGYELSPVLSSQFRRKGLSAGRVQSVALRLAVEREREITAFTPEEYWELSATFRTAGPELRAELYAVDGQRTQRKEGEQTRYLIASAEQAGAVERRAAEVATWPVASVERRERRRNPLPPFTTSTLQQAASSRLGWTASRTMRVAQRLYEGVQLGAETVGLITYMRTDSLRLSPEAVDAARAWIGRECGPEYLPDKPVSYAHKTSANAQDAHEAIRATYPARTPASLRSLLPQDEFRLYELIWSRFMACQMRPARLDQTTITLAQAGLEWRAVGSLLRFDGFLRIWGDPEGDRPLPEVRSGELLELVQVQSQQHFTSPPPRFNDASLVKALEEFGIGRPSTYASTIEPLERRGYLLREGKALRPSPLGMTVTDFLVEHFPKVLDLRFTADLESELDQIEERDQPWQETVGRFYAPFHQEVGAVPRERCPLCGGALEIRFSRFGQFLGCSNYPTCTYSAPLEAKQPPIPLGEPCPRCMEREGKVVSAPDPLARIGELVQKVSRYGDFIGCSRYPDCDYTSPLVKHTQLPCPKCQAREGLTLEAPDPARRVGEIVEKTSRRGKVFWSCSRYPDCDYSTFYPPLESRCPVCGWNQMALPDQASCSNPDCSEYRARKPRPAAAGAKRPAARSSRPGRASKPAAGKRPAAASKPAAGQRAPAARRSGRTASRARGRSAKPASPKASWQDLAPYLGVLDPTEQALTRARTEGRLEEVAGQLGIAVGRARGLMLQAAKKLSQARRAAGG